MAYAKEIGAPLELLREAQDLGRLPVVNFAAGGIATPADAALMMQLGVRRRLRRLRHLQVGRPGPARGRHRRGRHALQRRRILAKVSENLGEPMVGRNVSQMPETEKMAGRGW